MTTKTKEKFTELLIQDTLEQIEQTVDERLLGAEASFIAKLDGLKTMLNTRIDDISTIIEQKPYKVNFGSVEEPKSEIVHKAFGTVMNILKSQKRNPKNIMLVGEAGSGKTHLASCIAKAFGLQFYPMSVGLQTTKSDLLGFINAHGQYVTSPIREAFEHGGVLLLDEFDSAHAGVVTIINSLLANGHCSFPDKIVQKNDKFICLVACNTYGHGANIDYVGRNRLDGATLDRFITVHVGYDEQLESMLTCNPQWLAVIQQIRENIERQGIKMIVSPRASMNGADLLDAGFKIEDVIDMVIMKGADEDTKLKLMQGIDLTTATPTIIKREELKYIRDLSKYQTYEIRTNDESFESIWEVRPINNIIDPDFQETLDLENEYKIHAGRNWSHQYTGSHEIYFSTKGDSSISTGWKNLLSVFFHDLDRCPAQIHTNKGIAFEFVVKGCRKPWKVLTLEV